jgi:hypothetical protein
MQVFILYKSDSVTCDLTLTPTSKPAAASCIKPAVFALLEISRTVMSECRIGGFNDPLSFISFPSLGFSYMDALVASGLYG